MAHRSRGQLIPKGREKWLVRVYSGRDENGRRRYTSKLFEGTKTDAKEELDRMLAERADGRLVAPPRNMTVGEWLDEWLANVVKPSCRARTYADYTAVVDRYIRPRLGNMALRKLAPTVIRSWLVKLRESGLAPRTVRMAHEVLRNALRKAVRDRLLADNPAGSELVGEALPPKSKREPATIVARDVRVFLDVAAGDRLGAYWPLMLLTGLRPSEALALRWRDVKGDLVSVTRVLVDKVGLPLHFEQPKSKTSRRAVVLPAVVLAALREHRARQAVERLAAGPEWQDDDLIFCTPNGGALRQDQTRDAFKAILEAAELPPMRIYDLRHSAASLLLSSGESLSVVSELLGHSSISITKDTYGHIDAGAIRGAASRFDKLVSGR